MGNHYRLFGVLTVVTEDGVEHEVRGRNAAVLATLLASAPDAVSGDKLISQVWGEEVPKAPDTAVHSVISRLRSVVGDDIETTPIGYRVDPGSLDTHQFHEAVTLARATGRLEDYQTASSLWAGEPFATLEDIPTIALAIEQLHRIHNRSELERLDLLAREQPGIAADELALIVEREPYDEEALGIYMKALNAAGNKPAALQAFRHYQTLLAEETGLEPSAGIRELELAILIDELDPRPAPSRPPIKLDLSIEYVTLGDGRRLAIGRAGSGPPLVVHPGWLSKLDVVASGLDFRTPFWAALAQHFQLFLFDRYGTGLSQGTPDDLSLGASVDELRQVIRFASSGPVPVWGASGAGPIAISTASANPELVSHLILLGTFASGPTNFPPAIAASMSALIRASWGMGSDVLASLIFPDGTAEMRAGFAQFQKGAATPEIAAALLEQLYSADVSELLAELEVPALVIHHNGDKAVPARAGEELARLIPNSRYVPLEGTTHYPLPEDFDRVVSEIETFVNT